MKNIKISVLMPVYNAQNYLKDSIESILNQTFKNFEFIIVDDGSTDKSLEIMESYRKKDKRIIVLHNKERIGTTKTLNKGLFVAKGEFIVRMDADDWSYPDRLQKQYDCMQKHPEVGVSGGVIEVCDQDLRKKYIRTYPLTDKSIRRIIFYYSPFAHSATIWNRQLLIRINGYNENLPLSQDAELYFRIGSFSKFLNIKDILIKLRTHQNSSSISKDREQEKYAIYARIKAIMEYGYSAGFKEWLSIIGRIIIMFLVPTRIKFWIFNLLRRKK